MLDELRGMDPTADRPKWRDAVAGSLYNSGALPALDKASRHYELGHDEAGRLSATRRARDPIVLCINNGIL